ncbi:hypothetical protein Q8W40_27840 [Vibrio penaeicida]|uniref:hypothetical protein n=1 Tax=Vibrio penaeicida TaxID=104609 RepID=UPI0027336472|nr:hypothetical protein [Vibrio penaeicida]MDP2576015.1 hypothetical protein [Vibrio penaeicida]
MKIVHELYFKCNKETFLSVKKSPNYCLMALEKYVGEFKSKYLKPAKKINYDYAVSVVFGESLNFKTETQLNAYVKCQIKVAFEWFEFLIREIRSDKKRVTSQRLLKYGEYIVDFLHDVSPFIEYFEKKSDTSFSFLQGGKNYQQHTVFIYKDSINSYWGSQSTSNVLSHKGNMSASCYFLRQSLELKFRRLLGVNDIYDSMGNSAKIRHDFFPEFIKKNMNHFEMDDINVSNVLKIYKWTNSTIHTSATPRIWEQWFALKYCDKFFFPTNVPAGKSWSIHNSVKIKNLNDLWCKLYEKITEECRGDSVWCFQMSKPEAELRNV